MYKLKGEKGGSWRVTCAMGPPGQNIMDPYGPVHCLSAEGMISRLRVDRKERFYCVPHRNDLHHIGADHSQGFESMVSLGPW